MENVDTLIINRLGEHQRKVDFIQRNISRSSDKKFSFVKVSYAFMSVAACVAIILAIFPMLFRTETLSDISVAMPSFSEYRGAGLSNIESLLDSEKYEEALSAVNHELVEIDNELESLSTTEMTDEEKTYAYDLYNAGKEELMWCQIYLLLKLNKVDDLKIECPKYLDNTDFKEHATEVSEILKKIQ